MVVIFISRAVITIGLALFRQDWPGSDPTVMIFLLVFSHM